jgi:hypothetical protein
VTASPLTADARAWSALCERLAALGERLLTDEFPSSERDRAEGYAHLADQVVTFLGWAVRHADPYRPHFHRHNDLTSQWGGPNVDNAYKHARIDPSLRYRIRGRMHSCDDFILAVRVGFMHMPEWGTRHEVSASDIGIAAGDEIDLLLGGDEPDEPDERDGHWLPLPDGTTMVSIREYYIDWTTAEPAVLTIECLDDPPPPAPLDPTDLARRFDAAGELVERSVEYWNSYMAEARTLGPLNEFSGGFRQTKGLAAARYDFCCYDLGPDDALVIEAEQPDARYWSFHLYNNGWFEVPDRETRVTALNHTQAHVSRDGLIRVVVARRDPGVANWLDTSDRATGQLTFRWFWPHGDRRPSVTARVVPVDSVAGDLPDDTPRVDDTARRAEVAARAAHLAWRFRV